MEFLDRADPVMSWLGVMFALAVLAQFSIAANDQARPALNLLVTAMWAPFLAEFALKLLVAPRKGRFLRRHWLQALVLLAPALRVFSLVRLIRLGRILPAARVMGASYRTVGTTGRLVRSRVAYLGGLASVAIVAIGELAFVVDGGPHSDFSTLPSALLWSASTIIGMSPTLTPKPALARLVMLVGFVVGLVVIATLAGTLGSFLIDTRRDRDDHSSGTQHANGRHPQAPSPATEHLGADTDRAIAGRKRRGHSV